MAESADCGLCAIPSGLRSPLAARTTFFADGAIQQALHFRLDAVERKPCHAKPLIERRQQREHAFGQSALDIVGRKVCLQHLEAANQAIFRAFGKEIGLPDRAIDQTFKQLKRQVEKAASIIRPPDAEPADGFVHRFKEIVDNSCLRILET